MNSTRHPKYLQDGLVVCDLWSPLHFFTTGHNQKEKKKGTREELCSKEVSCVRCKYFSWQAFTVQLMCDQESCQCRIIQSTQHNASTHSQTQWALRSSMYFAGETDYVSFIQPTQLQTHVVTLPRCSGQWLLLSTVIKGIVKRWIHYAGRCVLPLLISWYSSHSCLWTCLLGYQMVQDSWKPYTASCT